MSLANCLQVLFPRLKTPTPLELISTCTELKLFDEGGLSPKNLYALCERALLNMTGLSGATVKASLSPAGDLAVGSLMYVRSAELLNVQEKNGRKRKKPQKSEEDSHENEEDSHVVLVESITENGTIVVINPDRAPKESGSGFLESQWGRMSIPPESLEKVWQSTRFDGTRTNRSAIHWVL